MTTPRRSRILTAVFYPAFFLSMTAFVLCGGGRLVLAFVDPFPDAASVRLDSIVVVVSSVIAVASGLRLWYQQRTRFVFTSLALLVTSIAAIYAGEFIAAFFVPTWPALGLHSVDPGIAEKTWGRAVALIGGATGFNSWGQRDLERSRRPVPGVRRVAFVGDSYLEESSTIPVNVVTEQRINQQHGGAKTIEILNLGVSGTDPDEYFYRIKNIALSLATDQCVVFFFTGNDFIPHETLSSGLGIDAVYPRDSLLNVIGLRRINHLLTTSRRPLLQLWGRAGELGRFEQTVGDGFKRGTNNEDLMLAAAGVPDADRDRVSAYLATRDLTSFYDMLAHPDNGLFRSYYLQFALRYIASRRKPEIDERFVYEYLLRSRQICEAQRATFLLVVIPEAFSVDTRMQRSWSALVDMKAVMAN